MATLEGYSTEMPRFERAMSLPQAPASVSPKLARTRSVEIPSGFSANWISRPAKLAAVHAIHRDLDAAYAAPNDRLDELQCDACQELIRRPIHAPCGHSFCEHHLHAAETNAQEQYQALEQAAAILRCLCLELKYPEARAREALAAAFGDLERAKELCHEASGLEGHAVHVRPDVTEPHFQWGLVSPGSVGRVTKVDHGHAHVDFATQSRWHCLLDEIEVDTMADGIHLGAVVRVRPDCQPAHGWGVLEGDMAGEIVRMQGARVMVQGTMNIWHGFVGELEPFHGSTDLTQALVRLKRSKPSETCRGALRAVLEEAANTTDWPVRIMLRGACRKAIMTTCGAMDVLRQAGFQISKWDQYRTRTLIVSSIDNGQAEAMSVLKAVEAEFGPSPLPSDEDGMRFTVLVTVDRAEARRYAFDEFWEKELRPKLIKSLAPPKTRWTWARKGWQDEEELKNHLKQNMLLGPTAVARGQTSRESKQISSSLEAQGLKVSTLEDGPIKGETAGVGEDPTDFCFTETWQGPVTRGARVHLVNILEKHPAEQPPSGTVGIVGGQIVHSEDGLLFLVNFPRDPPYFIKAGNIELDEEAELLQPGVRVKLKSGVEPKLGWQGVESSDVGVVHSIRFDGEVEVYMPIIGHFFQALLHELTTKDLPAAAQEHCPVCHETLLRGESLATDMVIEAQLRRLHQLMDGETMEHNNVLGTGTQQPGTPLPLERSKSHKRELSCSICLDLLVDPVTLNCGHSFCKAHIEAWLLQHHSCPNCKHRVLKERLHSRCIKTPKEALFEVELHDDNDSNEHLEQGVAARQTQSEEWPDIPVNIMLEKQLLRYFPEELESRKFELASENWENLQRRAQGYLPRLRAFLRQCDAKAIEQLVEQGLVDMDMKLPGTQGGTLLMLVAEQGLPGVLKELLKRKADPLAVAKTSGIGLTALSLAGARGRTDVLALLLDAGDWPATRVADALAAAVEQRHQSSVELLLSRWEGLAGLSNSFGFTAIITAVQTNSIEIIPTLLEYRAQVENALENGILVSGAGVAATNGVYQQVGIFAEKPYYQNVHGAVLYCKDWWKISMTRAGLGSSWQYSMPEPRCEASEPALGSWTIYGNDHTEVIASPAPSLERLGCTQGAAFTPLLLAAQLGFLETAKVLLNAQADPHACIPSTGERVLHIASRAGDIRMVRCLLQSRASATGTDAGNRTPLHAACSAGHHLVVAEVLRARAAPDSEELPTPLMLASCCGGYPPRPGKLPAIGVANKYSLVVAQLLAARANACSRATDGSSVLHLAASAGASAEAIKELLRAQARADATDLEGRTPLFAALLNGRSKAALALVEHVKSNDVSLTCQYQGLMPFSAAALLGDLALVQALHCRLPEQAALASSMSSSEYDRLNSDDLSGQLVRLTASGPDKNFWQLVQELLAPTPQDEASVASFEVGDWVMLAQGYQKIGHAAKGPIKPGDVAQVVKKDAGQSPFQVKLKDRSFWYRPGALCKYQVLRNSPSSWRGQLVHPWVHGGHAVNIEVQLETETRGHWQIEGKSPLEITLKRDGRKLTLNDLSGELELDGFVDQRGSISGSVIHLHHRAGSFVLIPSSQDATVRCPRGHAAERSTLYSDRTATCDVCSRSIKMDEPLFFTCRRCNYDVCLRCCGAPLLAFLPAEQPVNLASWTPLHFAAAAGHERLVDFLLTATANPRAIDHFGRTPLHWAVASGHGAVVDTFLAQPVSENHDLVDQHDLAAIKDKDGYLPIVFAPPEMLRFILSDGKQLQGEAVEVGRTAAGAPGEAGVAGIYRIRGKRDGRACYHRNADSGWIICWDEQTSRWGLYQEHVDAKFIQYQSKNDTQRCPLEGWVPVIASGPAPAFEEVLPWRAAVDLLKAMPDNLRPKPCEFKDAIAALPPLQRLAKGGAVRVGPEGISISLPPGAPPIEWIIQEMIRRGELPPEPPPGCLQQ